MNEQNRASVAVRTKGPHLTPLDDALHKRVRAACFGIPYRVIAEVTGFSEESVRRYMAGHKPTAAFLARICHAFEISPAWMLLGRAAPLERGAGVTMVDEPSALDQQFAELSTHIAALKLELDLIARPGDGLVRVEKRGDGRKLRGRGGRKAGKAAVEQTMKTQETRALRLVLGPADGQTLQIERPPGEEIEVRLDAKHPRAKLVGPDEAIEPAAKVYRYRRVLPQVYRWIDPASEKD